jgi:hypothetical protein
MPSADQVQCLTRCESLLHLGSRPRRRSPRAARDGPRRDPDDLGPTRPGGRRAPRRERGQARAALPRRRRDANRRQGRRDRVAAFPVSLWRKIWSTNPLERVNKEVKRRTDVVAIFPNEAAVCRLAGAVLLEVHDEWAITKGRYLVKGSMTTTRPAMLMRPRRWNEPRPSCWRPDRRRRRRCGSRRTAQSPPLQGHDQPARVPHFTLRMILGNVAARKLWDR